MEHPAVKLPGFNVIAKATGPVCNLDCRYCFYLEKKNLFPGTKSWAMADDALEAFIRQYIEEQHAPTISFVWQGGEPTLLGVDYFKKIIALQKKYAGGKTIENSFQTNGILLDNQWAEFFAENRFLVGISVDGPPDLHDCYRVTRGGRPTFDKVMEGLEVLKSHQVEFNTLTVVHRNNGHHPHEVYNFLKDIGSRFIQFIPLVQRLSEVPDQHGLLQPGPGENKAVTVSENSVGSVQFGEFLCGVFDEWVRADVGRYYVQVFDVALESWVGMPQSICVYSPTCGDALAIEHTGELYSCDHYVFPENRLGNIMDEPMVSLVASDKQRKFGRDKLETLPKYCRECEVRFACNGECPRNRFERAPDGEYGLNYLCAGYKRFFTHIDPYMQFMASELRGRRAPANVMTKFFPNRKFVEGKEQTPGRNDPCPCGSGKKYKRCCITL
jgi:uncharacterized protein